MGEGKPTEKGNGGAPVTGQCAEGLGRGLHLQNLGHTDLFLGAEVWQPNTLLLATSLSQSPSPLHLRPPTPVNPYLIPPPPREVGCRQLGECRRRGQLAIPPVRRLPR